MTFNFDEMVNRRGSNCVKWDEAPNDDIIPLWVADMDFRTAPAVIEAVERRAAHGIYGYEHVPETYYNAIISWHKQHHNWEIDRTQILYTIGVVPAISAVIKALTSPGDHVIITTPVYNCFFSSIRNNDCIAEECALSYDGKRYTIDYNALEIAAAKDETTLLILCNPHNPGGRVWTPAELARVSEICHRHGVQIVSDEIHAEFVMTGHCFTPFATVDHSVITCSAPSKAFNVAGLQNAYIVCPDAEKRAKIDRAININEVCDVNPFGVEALIAAYTEGYPWLQALVQYIEENYKFLRDAFAEHAPHLKVMELEGTYLAWVDCKALGMTSHQIHELLMNEAHVWVNEGTTYGAHGEGFIRINMACPRAMLERGLNRIFPCLQLR